MAIPARCLSGQASTRRELLKRCQLIPATRPTGCDDIVEVVEHLIDRLDRPATSGRIVGYHDIAEDAPRRSRTAPGTGRLACTVEVVHGARRHDEVEVALRQ